MENKFDIVDVNIGDFIVSVDKGTAEKLLTDSDFAQKYTSALTKQLSSSSSSGSEETLVPKCDTLEVQSKQDNDDQAVKIWKTSKNQTSEDHEATVIFLGLRKELSEEFNDKKTRKNLLWDKIASKMNEMGLFVGFGVDGREKCRQKFANLQATYVKTMDRRRQTGEGNIPNPPYFDELSEILGDKHKVSPVLVIDSIKEKEADKNSCQSPLTLDCPSPSTSGTSSAVPRKKSRFDDAKTSARPKKDTVIETIMKMHEENMEHRKTEFTKLVELMERQSERRHEEMLKLIASMSKKSNKSKPKRRTSESSDD